MQEEVNEKKGISFDTARLKDTLLNFIVPLVAFAVIAGLFMLIILPTMKSLPNLKQELTQKEALSEILYTKNNVLDRLVDFKSIVSENSTLVDRVLVSEEEPLPLQDQVYKMAIDAGLEVTKLSYSSGGGGKTEAGAYKIVGISIGIDGNYDELVKFFELVENAARFVQIDGFRFNLGKDNQSISTDMRVDAPYLFVASQAVTDDPIELDIASDDFIKFVNRLKELNFYIFSEPVEIPVGILVEGTEEETEGTLEEENPVIPPEGAEQPVENPSELPFEPVTP
ncbi:type 4a pilus biogenesis protein PilO [Patescibacteria group bacterium]|nr:type 4a pilus biogenesis protein PilO [Patescibacteria group bacterium]